MNKVGIKFTSWGEQKPLWRRFRPCWGYAGAKATSTPLTSSLVALRLAIHHGRGSVCRELSDAKHLAQFDVWFKISRPVSPNESRMNIRAEKGHCLACGWEVGGVGGIGCEMNGWCLDAVELRPGFVFPLLNIGVFFRVVMSCLYRVGVLPLSLLTQSCWWERPSPPPEPANAELEAQWLGCKVWISWSNLGLKTFQSCGKYIQKISVKMLITIMIFKGVVT